MTKLRSTYKTMNNYFVIGNPISHSLSPLIHNYWFKKYKIQSIYEKKKLEENDLKAFTDEMRNNKNINGANVTVPFKKKIIPFLDELTSISENTQSVNTIIKKNGKLTGHNTDATAFLETLGEYKRQESNKPLRSLVIGAGGVASSVIFALEELNNSESTTYIFNRTKINAEKMLIDIVRNKKGKYSTMIKPTVLEWGDIPKNLEIVVNTTTVGLKKDENLNLNFSNYKGLEHVLFYDLIYNPKETSFLSDAKKRGNKIMNGNMMFLLQAKQAFHHWTDVDVEIDDEILKLLD